MVGSILYPTQKDQRCQSTDRLPATECSAETKTVPTAKKSDLLYKLQGFIYATAIDLSMGYYHIPLDEESQKLCTTTLPWGKYRYRKLPMGIASSPDIFQSVMNDISDTSNPS